MAATTKPLTLHGIPAAAFTPGEAQAIVDNAALIAKYAADRQHYAAAGISLFDFASSELVNNSGEDVQISDDLMSGLRKQSREFESFHMQGK